MFNSDINSASNSAANSFKFISFACFSFFSLSFLGKTLSFFFPVWIVSSSSSSSTVFLRSCLLMFICWNTSFSDSNFCVSNENLLISFLIFPTLIFHDAYNLLNKSATNLSFCASLSPYLSCSTSSSIFIKSVIWRYFCISSSGFLVIFSLNKFTFVNARWGFMSTINPNFFWSQYSSVTQGGDSTSVIERNNIWKIASVLEIEFHNVTISTLRREIPNCNLCPAKIIKLSVFILPSLMSFSTFSISILISRGLPM